MERGYTGEAADKMTDESEESNERVEIIHEISHNGEVNCARYVRPPCVMLCYTVLYYVGGGRIKKYIVLAPTPVTYPTW
jgi:hypothetical protein